MIQLPNGLVNIEVACEGFCDFENASPLCIAPGGGCFCQRSDCHKMDGGTVP